MALTPITNSFITALLKTVQSIVLTWIFHNELRRKIMWPTSSGPGLNCQMEVFRSSFYWKLG